MNQSVEARALASAGSSTGAVLDLVEAALAERAAPVGVLLDVGCGRGDLGRRLRGRFTSYVGVDAIRHAGFPDDLDLLINDVDSGRVPLENGSADIVACVETIEHVENPRALVRELVRLARPGGIVLYTTPNQLSLASKLCLLARGQFLNFQDGPGLYPAHITALLEVDLWRIARECGLTDLAVRYSAIGRVPFTARPWPRGVGAAQGWRGRAFSDNVLISGRKPA